MKESIEQAYDIKELKKMLLEIRKLSEKDELVKYLMNIEIIPRDN